MPNQLTLWGNPAQPAQAPAQPKAPHAEAPRLPEVDAYATVASVWDEGTHLYIRFDAHARNIKTNAYKRGGKGGQLETPKPERHKLGITYDGQSSLFIGGERVAYLKDAPYQGEGKPTAYLMGIGAYSRIEAWFSVLGVNDEG